MFLRTAHHAGGIGAFTDTGACYQCTKTPLCSYTTGGILCYLFQFKRNTLREIPQKALEQDAP